MSYEGIYEIKGKAEVVYSAEIPLDSNGAINASTVKFYCTGNSSFCSRNTSITEDYVYCADTSEANLWNNEYLSNGTFELSNDGAFTGKTKYAEP